MTTSLIIPKYIYNPQIILALREKDECVEHIDSLCKIFKNGISNKNIKNKTTRKSKQDIVNIPDINNFKLFTLGDIREAEKIIETHNLTVEQYKKEKERECEAEANIDSCPTVACVNIKSKFLSMFEENSKYNNKKKGFHNIENVVPQTDSIGLNSHNVNDSEAQSGIQYKNIDSKYAKQNITDCYSQQNYSSNNKYKFSSNVCGNYRVQKTNGIQNNNTERHIDDYGPAINYIDDQYTIHEQSNSMNYYDSLPKQSFSSVARSKTNYKEHNNMWMAKPNNKSYMSESLEHNVDLLIAKLLSLPNIIDKGKLDRAIVVLKYTLGGALNAKQTKQRVLLECALAKLLNIKEKFDQDTENTDINEYYSKKYNYENYTAPSIYNNISNNNNDIDLTSTHYDYLDNEDTVLHSNPSNYQNSASLIYTNAFNTFCNEKFVNEEVDANTKKTIKNTDKSNGEDSERLVAFQQLVTKIVNLKQNNTVEEVKK